MLLLGIPAKVKGFCVPVCKDCLIYLTSLEKKNLLFNQRKEREGVLFVPIISEQEVSRSFRLELA